MSTKRQRTLQQYTGHAGTATLAHVERNVEQAYPTANTDLTGTQYGRLLNVANQSFHDGRASAGAWREDGLVGFDKICVPVSLLRAIRKTERVDGDWHITDYYIGDNLIYTERV